MKTFLFPSLLLFLLIGLSPLSAQSRIKTPDPAKVPTTELSAYGQSQRVLSDYADCLLRLNRPKVMDFLQEYIESQDAGTIGSRLAVPDCLFGADLRMTPRLLRGNLFGALYRRTFKKNEAPQVLSKTVDYRADIPMEIDSSTDNDAMTYLAYRHFADCVVKSGQEDMINLIWSEADSEIEKAAWEALVPKLSGCIVDGLEVRFTKSALLSLFSESLFRLSTASEHSGRDAFADVREAQN